MFWYNVRHTFRELKNSKLFSLITILGLAVGMAATILLFIYIRYELSFDRFNSKYDRTCKLISILIDDKPSVMDICMRLNDSSFTRQIPEVEQMVQLYGYGAVNADVQGRRIGGVNLLYTDPTFAQVFDVTFLDGNAATALVDPRSVVLTKSAAERIFGKVNVAGQSLKMEEKMVTVSAVVADFPETSSFGFDALMPLRAIPYLDQLGGLEFVTYVTFKDGIDADQAREKCCKLYKQLGNARFNPGGYTMDCFLQPMSRIHLYTDFNSNVEHAGSISKVYTYLLLAFLILTVAIINFVNLLTVFYEGRMRNIAVQKSIGISNRQLRWQLLGKSLIYSGIALVIAAILVELTIAPFGNLVSRDLTINYASDPLLLIWLPLLSIVVGVVAGLYPAIYVSRFPLQQILKGERTKIRRNRLTTILVVAQFAVTIVLVISIVVLNRQIRYMKTVDLGVNIDNVITVRGLTEQMRMASPAIVDALSKIPSIQKVGVSHHLPGGGTSGQGIEVPTQGARQKYGINEYRVGPGYFDVLGISFLMGRPFSDNIKDEGKSIILNEGAVKRLGLTDPLNQPVIFNGEPGYRVVGVVKNFHYASLRDEISPLLFRATPNIENILIAVSKNQIAATLKQVEATLRRFDSQYELDYLMLSDVFRDRYKSEEQTATLTTVASVLALILALLGLYALTIFMVTKRTKEIGIRKVNGATNLEIMLMLLAVFARWIAVAFVIAVPVAYYFMDSWLQNFAYRQGMGVLPFILAGGIAFVVAMVTVGGQAWRAASRNPVEALRYE